MKNITDLKVTELRLFKFDVIPFNTLMTATQSNLVTSTYLFKDAEVRQDENKNILQLVMRTGEFKYNKQVYPIELLSIERNRIIFSIYSDSNIANKFYQEIANALAKIDSSGQFKKNKPLIKTMETMCVAKLDIDYSSIFSNKMNSFNKNKASKACSSAIDNVANVQILPRGLTFDVTYEVSNKPLLENKVTIQTKQIRIEPRWGIDLKENLFYLHSPTDSKTHLKLLSEFEKVFKSSKK